MGANNLLEFKARYFQKYCDIKKADNLTFVTTLTGLECNVITDENGNVTYTITSTSDDYDEHDKELLRQLQIKFNLISNRWIQDLVSAKSSGQSA